MRTKPTQLTSFAAVAILALVSTETLVAAPQDAGSNLAATSVAETPGRKVFRAAAPAVCLLVDRAAGAVGSGSFVLEGQHILTCQHVAARVGDVLEFAVYDERATTAEPQMTGAAQTVAVDIDNDLALLRVVRGQAPATLSFGAMAGVGQGSRIYALGHPRGIPWCFSEGTVSAVLHRHDYRYEDGIPRQAQKVILSATPIDPGSSGGPLLDPQGRLIGVNSFVARGHQLSNYAIAGDVAERFVAAHRNAVAEDSAASGPQDGGDVLSILGMQLSNSPDLGVAAGREPLHLERFYLHVVSGCHEEFVRNRRAMVVTVRLERQDASTGEWAAVGALPPLEYGIGSTRLHYSRELSLTQLGRGSYRLAVQLRVGGATTGSVKGFVVP